MVGASNKPDHAQHSDCRKPADGRVGKQVSLTMLLMVEPYETLHTAAGYRVYGVQEVAPACLGFKWGKTLMHPKALISGGSQVADHQGRGCSHAVPPIARSLAPK